MHIYTDTVRLAHAHKIYIYRPIDEKQTDMECAIMGIYVLLFIYYLFAATVDYLGRKIVRGVSRIGAADWRRCHSYVHIIVQ